MKTLRLYYTDCYSKEFEARVVRVADTPKGCRVYLDQTAFYPESGGQPPDHGLLGGLAVLDVADEEDEVAHVMAERPAAESVKGEIDWSRRLDHMQQHTGQHILSAAFERTGEYKTISFHLGAESSTIDLNSDRLGRRQLENAEDLANQVVFENREVRIFSRPESEAAAMDLRKPATRKGEVRLVEVTDFDLSACGGTHVRRTGEIGLILIRKMERVKGMTRVEFVCGKRALRAARKDCSTLAEAAALFSARADDLPALVKKQAEELRESLRRREKLSERLAKLQADELHHAAVAENGRRIIRRVFGAEESASAKVIAHALAKFPDTIALLGVRGRPAALFFAQAKGGGADMAWVLRETLARAGGKGGGTRDFAQGGGLDEAKLEEALTFSRSLLR